VTVDEVEDHHVVDGRERSAHPLDPWGNWILRWFAAMLATIYLSVGSYLAVGAGRPITLLLLAVWVPALALFAGGMTIVAAGLRWALVRLAPAWRNNTVVVASTGALAGPLALLLLFATEQPGVLLAPGPALGGVFAPLALGGGMAGYLAERQLSVKHPRWWLLVLVAAATGLALASLAT
jgi:hypothetical protein